MEIQALINSISFVLTVAGFILGLIPQSKENNKKFIFFSVIIILFGLILGIEGYKSMKVKHLANEIPELLKTNPNNKPKELSEHEIFTKLIEQDPNLDNKIFQKALNFAYNDQMILSDINQIKDQFGREYQYRVYYLENEEFEPINTYKTFIYYMVFWFLVSGIGVYVLFKYNDNKRETSKPQPTPQ